MYVCGNRSTVFILIEHKLKKKGLQYELLSNFLVKVVSYYIKIHYENPRMRIFLRKLNLAFY